jgi:hypothetical protein
MRKFRAPQLRVRDVTRIRAGVTDETLSRKSPACKKAQCCLLERDVRDVTRPRSGMTDITRQQPCSAWHLAHAREKEGEKGRKDQEFPVHIYPTFSSRPRGRCVQRLVQIGSET